MMALFTMDNGLKVNVRDRGSRFGRMDPSMRDTGRTTKLMDMVV